MLYSADPTAIKTADKGVATGVQGNTQSTVAGFAEDIALWVAKWGKDSTWSSIFQSTLRTALGQIAYDAGKWIGSGGKGQKPLFITKGWGAYMTNLGDQAAGQFVEAFGNSFDATSWGKFNLCKPTLNAKIGLGLGLVNMGKPAAPNCKFSDLQTNWETEITKKDFVNRFVGMFDISQNDWGASLTLQTGMIETVDKKAKWGELERQTNGGWLDVKSLISNKILSTPKNAEDLKKQGDSVLIDGLGKYTGSALTDSLSIFLNQLALSAFNTMMSKLGESINSGPEPYSWTQLQLSNFSDSPTGAGTSGSVTSASKKLLKIIEPKFNSRGDYNILTELTQCQDPTKAGPTDCVLPEKFSQAISLKKTVAEAVKDGYINGGGAIGFLAPDLEPNYLEGYPYRSLIILRKYRILPVGWEIAAQYIQKESLPGGTALAGKCTLGDLMACYSDNDSYIANNAGCPTSGNTGQWCRNLVDPNWVLKAPLNYCRKEGPGPEITSQNVTGQGTESQVTVSRDDKYCADEQACIKENDDGTCKLYGYCVEERRKWKFGSSECEPEYNTCQAFNKADGTQVGYLENTLDYNNCNSGVVGCADYCTEYSYANKKFTCTTSTGDKIFLDRDAKSCDAESEGCHQFIRTKGGLGANLLINSNFEDNLASSSWNTIGAISSDSYLGSNSLNLKIDTTTLAVDVAPTDYSIQNEAYTITFQAKNCLAGSMFQFVDEDNSVELPIGSNWQGVELTQIMNALDNKVTLQFVNPNGACLIDAIKLERSVSATAYSDYGQQGMIYEKIMPSYLTSACSVTTNRPAECDQFARYCTAEEVGCELYTPKNGDITVPAKVRATDYCVQECVGFNSYVQGVTTFDSQREEHFIPRTGKQCSAANVGCDEFTNLDKLTAGGEAIEYYSDLRQCVRADDGTCDQYYTWEGSNETGYQLKVLILSAKDKGTEDSQPIVTASDSATCNETIFTTIKQNDPNYNPDCREFYNKSGKRYYHLLSKTKSCSDNCHPYRRSEVNTDPNATDLAACNALPVSAWDNDKEECIVCINGGELSDDKKSCLYNAIPGEGKTCSAAAAGCREYTGSFGQNVRTVVLNDFEDGTTQNWSGNVALAITSINLNGHSLEMDLSAATNASTLDVKGLLVDGKTYTFDFIARTESVGPLKITMQDTAGNVLATATTTPIGGEWNRYSGSWMNVPTSSVEKIVITAVNPGKYYVDWFKLTMIADRYYVIKNSWNTPDTCNQDLNKRPFPLYMLGCAEYRDRDKTTHYLKSFSYLCQDNAVGCEMMIDTKNSTDPKELKFNEDNANTADNVTVPADNFVYAVYDKTKQCEAKFKGCQLLGKSTDYAGERIHQSAYIINDPDSYNASSGSLCKFENVQCSENAIEGQDGFSYFKNPQEQICEWRQKSTSSPLEWVSRKVSRCATSKSYCLTDADCNVPVKEKCVLETTDKACPFVSTGKTLGIGDAPIYTPDNKWVGSCPLEQSGCTELVEPNNRYGSNLLVNGSFIASGGLYEGWENNGAYFDQKIGLSKYTIYRVGGTGYIDVAITCTDALNNSTVQLLNNSNKWDNIAAGYTLQVNGGSQAYIFRTWGSSNCSVGVLANTIHGGDSVELKEVPVDYILNENFDKKTCNGLVDPAAGCVLFNQRSQNGKYGLASTTYDADITAVSKPEAPQSNVATPALNDSNLLLKVSPDRVCDKWLSCETKIGYKDESGHPSTYCSAITECSRADDSGNCLVSVSNSNKDHSTKLFSGLESEYQNMSGYSKVGYNNALEKEMIGDLSFGEMTQVGNLAAVPNGDFEFWNSTLKPSSWTSIDNATNNSVKWNANHFQVVTNPVTAQAKGVKYPISGKSIFQLGGGFAAQSDAIHTIDNTSHYLSYFVNTKNMSTGTVEVWMNDIRLNVIQQGQDWQFITSEFTPNGLGNIIRLKGLSDSGNAYFDNFLVTANLESKKNVVDINQSCRLFPEKSALACDYIGSNGMKYKGWKGYCLEHDRKPGNPDACLLWYPVDRVKGDEIVDEGVGYNGKAPLYFCSQSQANMPIVKTIKQVTGSVYTVGKGCSSGGYPMNCDAYPGYYNLNCPAGTSRGVTQDILFSKCDSLCTTYCQLDASKIVIDDGTDAWIEYPGQMDGLGSFNSTPQNAFLIMSAIPKGTESNIPLATSCASRPAFTAISCPHYYVSGATESNITATEKDCDYGCVIDYTNYYVANGTGANANRSYVKYDATYDIAFGGPYSKVVYNPVTAGTRFPNFSDFKLYNKDIDNSSVAPPVDPKSDELYGYCTKISRVVTESGDNKYWSARVFSGSKFVLDPGVNRLNYTYDTPSSPFGSILEPVAVDPSDWDGSEMSGKANKDPLYHLGFVDMTDYDKYAHAGQPYSISFTGLNVSIPYFGQCTISHKPCFVNNAGPALPTQNFICASGDGVCEHVNYPAVGDDYVKSLFAQSYGTWYWDGFNRKYEISAAGNWAPPTNLCITPAQLNETTRINCYKPPIITNIIATPNSINRNGFVKLTFTSEVNINQRPLTGYKVKWKDGTMTGIAGIRVSDKPNLNDPHTLYHMYDYWKMYAKGVAGCDATKCVIQPEVEIIDNWGKSSGVILMNNTITIFK